jgi:hypothetical protein
VRARAIVAALLLFLVDLITVPQLHKLTTSWYEEINMNNELGSREGSGHGLLQDQESLEGLKKSARQFSEDKRITIEVLLWNPKVHHRVHNSPSLTPILNQQTFSHHVFKINFNSILPSKLRFPKWFSLQVSQLKLYFIVSPMLSICPFHFIFLYINQPNNNI